MALIGCAAIDTASSRSTMPRRPRMSRNPPTCSSSAKWYALPLPRALLQHTSPNPYRLRQSCCPIHCTAIQLELPTLSLTHSPGTLQMNVGDAYRKAEPAKRSPTTTAQTAPDPLSLSPPFVAAASPPQNAMYQYYGYQPYPYYNLGPEQYQYGYPAVYGYPVVFDQQPMYPFAWPVPNEPLAPPPQVGLRFAQHSEPSTARTLTHSLTHSLTYLLAI
jgi:hypothetical protein